MTMIKSFINTTSILLSKWMLMPVYADDFFIDTPNFKDTTMLTPAFFTALNTVFSFLNQILNILIALGVISSIVVGIILAVQYAAEEIPSKRAKNKKDFITLFVTTAGLGGLRLIIGLLLAILQ